MALSKTAPAAAWTLGLIVSALAFINWGHDNAWHLSHLSVYLIFPLLGLLAFSLMWTHYVIGTVRDLMDVKPEVLKPYYRWTGYAVLVLICLHPGLLIWQRWRDGHGFPPGSYESYVAHGMGWITILGTASLCVFLAFELRRWFGKYTWWHYVVDASDLAMLAIIYHSFRLGSQLQIGWFRYVWWFYTATFIAVLIRKYSLKFNQKVRA
jgi:hypothetical protein